MLTAKNIAVGYPEKTVLENITLSAEKGERIALVGLNGTGKSTLMLSLAGLIPLKSGGVVWNQQSLLEMTAVERARLLAVVTTDRFKTGNLTAVEVVAMGRYPYTGLFGRLKASDWDAVGSAIKTCGLEEIRQHPFEQLSDGQKQRTLIARALAQQTPLVLMDEPTSFLDIRGKSEVFELMEHLGDQLVIFSTHEVERACRVATRCWVIDEEGVLHDLPTKGDGALENIRRALGLSDKELW